MNMNSVLVLIGQQDIQKIMENCQLDTAYRLFARESIRQQPTGHYTLATFQVQRI